MRRSPLWLVGIVILAVAVAAMVGGLVLVVAAFLVAA